MKVRLFLEGTIREFSDKHANGKKLFTAFLTIIKNADWLEPNDIRKTINSNLLGNGSDRIVFDVGGNGKNAFRVICEYKFGCYYRKDNIYKVHLYVNWIGTHEEYNSLTEKQKLTVCMY